MSFQIHCLFAQISARIVSEQQVITAGEDFRLGVMLTIEEEWYTYWINPGDAGMAPDIKIDLPVGFELIDIQYPAPEKFESDEVVSFGYKDSIMFVLRIKNKITTAGTYPITIDCSWLVCKEVCLPGNASLTFNIVIGPKDSLNNIQVNKLLFEYYSSRVPLITDEIELSHTGTGKPFILNIKFNKIFGSELKLAEVYPFENGIFRNIPSPKISSGSEGYSVHFTLEEGIDLPSLPLKFLFVFYDSKNKLTSFESTLNIKK
ncbi:MAG: hypothetical protein HUU54_00120 [Ignavibacteriaceae bacterium]|nr:hypothetical protein [Ignavibacteriaceae bacterium]